MKIVKVIRYFFVVLYGFIGLISIATSPVSAILCLLAAFLMLPIEKLDDFWEEKNIKIGLRILVAVILFIVGISLLGAKTKADKGTEPTAAPVATDAPTKAPTTPPTDSPTPTQDLRSEEEKVISARITDQYANTTITEITLNPDLGTAAEDDLIALVYLTWDVKNSEATSKEMLKMYSDDLAVEVAEKCPKIQEIAIFWKVPCLDKNAKYSYKRKGENMYVTDTIWN